jgi:hypothetical protein
VGGSGGGGCFLDILEDLLNKNVNYIDSNYHQKLIENDVYGG